MKVINPMNEAGCCFTNATQCTAKSKRTKQRCRGPAVTGWSVCRFHGAGGGAPKGKANGRYGYGLYTNDAIQSRRKIRELVSAAKALSKEIG